MISTAKVSNKTTWVWVILISICLPVVLQSCGATKKCGCLNDLNTYHPPKKRR
jgi:hypothetical protein